MDQEPKPSWQYLWRPYCQMKTAGPPLRVARTEKEFLVLDDGRRLVDGIASWWTACHGYNQPAIVEAICEQARRMPHVMLGGLVHDRAIELADDLIRLVGWGNGRVFFSDSGSVAVEVAMKMLVQYWRNRGVPNRHRFVCFRDAYHGDTSGAMSVGDPVDGMHHRFKGFLLEQYPRPLPRTEEEWFDFHRFLDSRSADIAGLIIEPLAQMAAGMRFHDVATLRGIHQAAQRFELPWIADEVATGFGRTGAMFACQQARVRPDIICLGKALTGGHIGLAATLASEKIYSAFHSDRVADCLMHGPTFMGNPIACAAALASIRLFRDEPRLEQVAALESQMRQALEPLRSAPRVREVRVLGAIGVVEMEEAVAVDKATSFFVDRGVWIRPLRDVVYLCPSFTIGQRSLDQLCGAIREYVEQAGEE